jgi:hypothetical protein
MTHLRFFFFFEKIITLKNSLYWKTYIYKEFAYIKKKSLKNYFHEKNWLH